MKNGCGNYDGTNLLSHYHEAAYDSHMTGVVFAHIIKFKEIERLKIISSKDKKIKNKKKEGGPQEPNPEIVKPDSAKNQAIKILDAYPDMCKNKMMMDAYGSGRVYCLVPELHLKQFGEF